MTGFENGARMRIVRLPAAGLLAAISVYRILLSPLFAGSCRFVPSCSEYARGAISGHGALRGGWLAVRRLARCHPLCRGGFDQVPVSPRPKAR